MLLAEIWTTRSQALLESEKASRPFREKTVLTLTKGLHTSYQETDLNASAQENSGPSKIVSPPVQPTRRGNWSREEKAGAKGERAHGAKCEPRGEEGQRGEGGGERDRGRRGEEEDPRTQTKTARKPPQTTQAGAERSEGPRARRGREGGRRRERKALNAQSAGGRHGHSPDAKSWGAAAEGRWYRCSQSRARP